MKKVYQKMKAEIIDLSQVSDEALAFAGYVDSTAVKAPRKKLSLYKADGSTSPDERLQKEEELFYNQFSMVPLSGR